jgi:hypothetical protein
MGKPCQRPEDCGGRTVCFHEVDAERRIRGPGYCTADCKDASDCESIPGASCEATIATHAQGAEWDGTIAKDGHSCVKR